MSRTLHPLTSGRCARWALDRGAPMREAARSLGAALRAALLVPPLVQTPCYHYSPAVVTLQGALVRRGAPGPRHPARAGAGGPSAPTASGDSAPVLALATPICVAPDSASPDSDRRVESGVRELRLAIGSDSVWAELQTTRTLRLRVTGELFRAHAGRPRSAVVIWVLRIAAAE